MIRSLKVALIAITVALTVSCSTPTDGNIMPEGEATSPLWGYGDMCRDPERYREDLCPAKETEQ